MFKNIILTMVAALSISYAQSIETTQNKWRLAGAIGDINIANDVSKYCSIYTFGFDTQKFTNYKGGGVSTGTIQAGAGIWVLGNGGTCTIKASGADASHTPSTGSGKAMYELTFNATWSASTHPKGFPSNPHFSPLIGMVNGQGVHIYNRGKVASPGIKVMAETGSPATLKGEMQKIPNARIVQGNKFDSPGSSKVTFEADDTHAYLSLVSMIAPSPDWFVAINAVYLKDASGKWIDGKTIELKLYDAGTDSGTTFTSSNVATSPAGPITFLNESAVDISGGAPIVGTFVIKKIN